MKIALLGAPKSGKSKFAKALAKELADVAELKVIDNYVNKLSKRSDTAMSHFASYIPNLMVATERVALENAAGDNFITCGTIFDTISYTVLHGRAASKFADEAQAEAARASATLGAMGMLVADTFKYDYAFYLPYKKDKDDWNGDLNRLIPLMVEQHYYYVTSLDGTLEENVDLATTVIRKLEKEKNETPSDDE